MPPTPTRSGLITTDTPPCRVTRWHGAAQSHVCVCARVFQSESACALLLQKGEREGVMLTERTSLLCLLCGIMGMWRSASSPLFLRISFTRDVLLDGQNPADHDVKRRGSYEVVVYFDLKSSSPWSVVNPVLLNRRKCMSLHCKAAVSQCDTRGRGDASHMFPRCSH